MNTTRRLAQWGAENPELSSAATWWPVFFLWNYRPPVFFGSGMISMCDRGILVQGQTIRRWILWVSLGVGLVLVGLALLSPWTLAGFLVFPWAARVRKIRSLEIRYAHVKHIWISRKSVRIKIEVSRRGCWTLSFRARPSVVHEFAERLTHLSP